MIFTATWKEQGAEGKRNLQLFENEVSGRYLTKDAVSEQFRQGCAAGAAPGPLTNKQHTPGFRPSHNEDRRCCQEGVMGWTCGWIHRKNFLKG
jgi:hypothetical protein